MTIRHIYWFAYFNIAEPSVRYRAKYPLEQLKVEHNITFSIVYPGYDFKSILKFLTTFFAVLLFRKKGSIIVFQKIYTNGIYTNALKVLLFFRPKHTLYDIDDAEHTRYPAAVIHHFMKRCSVCAAGSNALVDYIHQFNQNVLLLTSPVIDHGLIKDEKEKVMTIGWIGYYGAHRQNLMQLFFPALDKIGFPIKLKILGVKNEVEENEIRAYFKHNSNILIDTPQNLKWLNEKAIYENILSFDIGVSPLLDTEFNQAKSAFKLKQCLSCGVPVLAGSIGENKAFIQNGVNGYFCDNPSEYLEKILFIKNLESTAYKQLSNNAKLTFHTFSINYYCSTLLDYYKDKTG